MERPKNNLIIETEYMGANVSSVTTEKGLVLIDSPLFPDDAKNWKKYIEKKTGKKIAYMINTDHHFDHIAGNSCLTNNVICHKIAAKGIKNLKRNSSLISSIKETYGDKSNEIISKMDEAVVVSPFMSFEKEIIINCGDAIFELVFVGGHSPGTILIHWLEENVVFTGDNVEGGFPYFGQARFNDWIKALQIILSYNPEIVVPGHGPIGDQNLIHNYLQFFKILNDEVNYFHQKGFTIDQMSTETKMLNYFDFDIANSDKNKKIWIKKQYKKAAELILKIK